MKKVYLVTFMLLSISYIYGQEVQDTIPKRISDRPIKTENPYDNLLKPNEKRFQLDDPTFIDQNDSNSTTNQLTNQKAKIDIDMSTIKVVNAPPITLKNSRYPFANDYAFYAGYQLAPRLSMATSSVRATYPTYGQGVSVGARFNYAATDWWIISGGPSVSKYNVLNTNFNDASFGGSMKFKVSDRLRFNAYGQYSLEGKFGSMPGPMMNSTYYGGTMEFKVNDNFGVEAGMIRELNPFSGKWENRPVINPVFYIK